ncbi:hypothetical protein KIL84_006838 [Mauremys mutica]|uniref:Uncharacterized protein n=1 Tax=Mauremys mutica TaxID=74926 RepID=A0A9D3X1Y9_9SAUR|nr:hypothetical protein KIL84_006838 [Mauremys mutica]
MNGLLNVVDHYTFTLDMERVVFQSYIWRMSLVSKHLLLTGILLTNQKTFIPYDLKMLYKMMLKNHSSLERNAAAILQYSTNRIYKAGSEDNNKMKVIAGGRCLDIIKYNLLKLEVCQNTSTKIIALAQYILRTEHQFYLSFKQHNTH